MTEYFDAQPIVPNVAAMHTAKIRTDTSFFDFVIYLAFIVLIERQYDFAVYVTIFTFMI